MANTFFLADAATSRVSLWCEPRGRSNGRRKFSVVNGGWLGEYDEITGDVYVEGTIGPTGSPVKNVWEGQVPPYFDYTEAFEWLEKTHGFNTKP